MKNFKPDNADQLCEVVKWAAAERVALSVQGGGNLSAMGRPVEAAHLLDLSGFSGVSLYEAEELVLTAGAATPLAEIEALLGEHHQMLAFEPPDYSGLLGADRLISGRSGDEPRSGTLGGALAGNLSGPRRFQAGAARDHFLGFRAISGRGDHFKSGGRVVKNVTGYDLSKLMAGSWGTLAALWEVTVKVVPRPEKTYTLLLYGLDDRQAASTMTRALASPHEVSGAAHLPETVACRSSVSYAGSSGQSVTALRVEGPGPSVRHRIDALKDLLGGNIEELHSHNSLKLWREIRDVRFFARDVSCDVWRISTPPADCWKVVAGLADIAGAEWFYDAAGGLIWLQCASDVPTDPVRRALAPEGGHATLWRADPAKRSEVEVFQPQPPALAALNRRVKESFDPHHILNPGRIHAD